MSPHTKWVAAGLLVVGLIVLVRLMGGDSPPVAELPEVHEEDTGGSAEALDSGEGEAGEAPVDPEPRVVVHTIAPGDTVGGLLQANGVVGVRQIVELSKEHLDLARVKPGQELEIAFIGETPTDIWLKIDMDRRLHIELTDPVQVGVDEKVYDVEPVAIRLNMQQSLWQAGTEQGFSASLIMQMAKVFENEVDFNTDLRPGAAISVVVDSLTHESEFVRYDNLHAMVLENVGKTWTAIYHTDKAGKSAWYDLDGENLGPTAGGGSGGGAGGFRAPFEYGRFHSHQTSYWKKKLKKGQLRVSSDFYQPRCGGKCRHHALDFTAAQGTPVVAIGSGVVRAITGPGGLCGNGVQLAMTDSKGQKWRTLYCHLSKISVSKKQKVKKGQRIGLSGGKPGTRGAGNTTGPHLHLELRKKSKKGSMRLVDPLEYLDWGEFDVIIRHTKGYGPGKKRKTKKRPKPKPLTETSERDAFVLRRDALLLELQTVLPSPPAEAEVEETPSPEAP